MALITKVENFGTLNAAADWCLFPLRNTLGGRLYHPTYDQDGNMVNLLASAKSTCKGKEIAIRFFSALLTLIALPVVLVGLILKAIALSSSQIQTQYQHIKILAKSPLLILDTLGKLPKATRFEKDQKLAAHIPLKRLVGIWDKVDLAMQAKGERRDDHQAIRDNLANLAANAPDPTKYTLVPAKDAPATAVRFQKYLRALIFQLDKPGISDNEKERTLIALAQAAAVCAPTWIEVAKTEYLRLEKSDTPKNKLLREVVSCKEALINEYIQREDIGHWHGVNYVRYHLGKELGLDRSDLASDPHFSRKEDPAYPRELVRELFYQLCTPEALIRGVREGLNAKGFARDFAQHFREIQARKQGISVDKVDDEKCVYIYYTDGRCTEINEEGIRRLFIHEGLLG